VANALEPDPDPSYTYLLSWVNNPSSPKHSLYICHLTAIQSIVSGCLERKPPARNCYEPMNAVSSLMAKMSVSEPVLVAAVEAGGNSFRVAVADLSTGSIKILQTLEVNSSHDDPKKTIAECAAFLEKYRPQEGYHALGIASFGPFGVSEKNASTYGTILESSPKAHWRNINLLEPLRKTCQGPKRTLKIKIDTDVNAPALAEYLVSSQSISSLAYITCGTGVGVGLVIHGQCVHGRMHPEAGHVPVQPLPGDTFQGYSWGTSKSPFQGVHTVEGIASAVALTERLQQMQGLGNLDRNVLGDLPDDHEIWDHAGNALANLCVTLLLTVSVEKIVIGGGVLKRRGLLEKIRKRTVELINGYIPLPDDMSNLICSPHYGDTAGLVGAIVLAQEASAIADSLQVDFSKKENSSFYHGATYGALVGAATAIAIMTLFSRKQK
jgi:fructokinase